MDGGVTVGPADMVRLELFEAVTGVTVKAVEKKIEAGTWYHGHVVHKAPDGKWNVCLPEYYTWVRGA